MFFLEHPEIHPENIPKTSPKHPENIPSQFGIFPRLMAPTGTLRKQIRDILGILGMFWDILGMCWGCFGDVLGMYFGIFSGCCVALTLFSHFCVLSILLKITKRRCFQSFMSFLYFENNKNKCCPDSSIYIYIYIYIYIFILFFFKFCRSPLFNLVFCTGAIPSIN